MVVRLPGRFYVGWWCGGAGVGCGGSAGRRTEKLERTEELKTNGVGGGLCGQRFRVQRSNDNGNSLQVGLLLS